jgi:dTDP-glucose 4,6-dehydratase
MHWACQTVLVTGAGGFIGSHLVERLVALGARTRGLVHYNSTGSKGWLNTSPVSDDIEIIFGDICDRDSLRQAVKGVDVVFHLAALIGIPYSYHAPLSYLRQNIEGTVNVLQSALEFGVKLVVHTSTSEVYGTARYVPIDEGHPLQGQSPYAASKIGADKWAEAFHRSFGLPVTILRPFNTFGPRQSARAIIPTIITQALTQSEVHLGSLEPRRDFNFITDTVDGFIRIAEFPEAVGQVINIGSGREMSIGDLATTILNLTEMKKPILSDKERIRPHLSEVERLWADCKKAHEIIGWQPKCTLSDGLFRTIEWVKENLENYQPKVYSI